MSTPTVIVYGPQACGKTTWAEVLRKHFGCDQIVDDWMPGDQIRLGAIHLTRADLYIEAFGSSVPTHRFDETMAAIRRCETAKQTSNKINPGKIVLTEMTTLRDWQKTGDITRFDGTKIAGEITATHVGVDGKPSNPKDGIGIRKWRQFVTVPFTVIAEVGVAMLEGGLKYSRHNYRVAGVRASVYVDAAIGHIMQWWEGEDLDPDTNLSHITKAIASLVVLRDAMIQDMLNDDRPPKAKLGKVRNDLQSVVNNMFEKYPDPKSAVTEVDVHADKDAVLSRLVGAR